MRTRRRLAALRQADLTALHTRGSCPDPERFLGALQGEVLSGPLGPVGVRRLGIWRGKHFDRAEGRVGGLNRVGLGPLETLRFRFEARVERSLFSDRHVMLLDHDRPSNPRWVRRFHDELVEVEPGLFLASSHVIDRPGAEPDFVCWFALADPTQG